MTTITFNERKVIWFVLFVMLLLMGGWSSYSGLDTHWEGRIWLGGLFCGFALSCWCAFLFASHDGDKGE